MPTLSEVYPALVEALDDHYGPLATSRLAEGPLAAFLGRSLDPRKVARLIDALRDAGLLDADALADVDLDELTDAARSAGVPLAATVARPALRLTHWVAERGEALTEAPTEQLRDELLAIRGVGPPSADAILLHGLGRPVFPVDRGTYRILVRHGWLDPSAGYDEARDLIERQDDGGQPPTLARLATWFERIGGDFCRPTVAHCDRCPLRDLLPEGGPIEPEG